MKSRLARLRLAALVSIVCVSSTALADGATLASLYQTYTLTWTPPTENVDGSPLTDLLGYYIYSGPSPDTMVPYYFAPFGRSSFQVRRLKWGTYYFGMTAVNNDGIESAFTGTVNTHGR
jgi:hypothetical protein